MIWYLNNADTLILGTKNEKYENRYIKADYIVFDTANGNRACIDTGFTEDNNTTWDILFIPEILGAECWFAGSWDLDNNIQCMAGTVDGYNWYTANMAYSPQYPSTSGTQFIATKQTSGSTYSYPYTIIIGGRNAMRTTWTNPSVNNAENMRFKVTYFRIKKNGNWVAEYFPAYDPVNEEWGMYDVIGNQFHSNAGAEGTSIAGGYYPPEEDVTPAILPYDYNDIPNSAWYMNSSELIVNDMLPYAGSWVRPYPASMWFLNNEQLVINSLMPNKIGWEKPYPASMWYYDEELGYLTNSFLPDELDIPEERDGAFKNCSNLHYVRIPRSVAEIGSATFAGTALTKVCISRQCRYSSGSFPNGCTIIFYEDLYDVDYDEFVAGVNAFRSTEIHPYDESSDIQPEIP